MTEQIVEMLNLQLFADGATAGASSGSVGGSTTNSGENSSNALDPARDKATAKPKAKIVYGKQNTVLTDTETQSTDTERKSFKDLIESEEYSEEAKAYMDKTFSKRFAKYKGIEEENAKMRSILEMSNMRYGLDPNSDTYLDDFAQKVQGDKKLYEDEAMEAGMDVEQYIKVKNAERIIEQNRRFEADRQQNELIQGHINNMIGQAEKLQSEFANFNLEAELQNPTFKRLVDPPSLGGAGISVRDAFFAVHHDEITKAIATSAVNQATINTANAISNNKSRPVENGLTNKASVIVKDDPSKFKKSDFDSIKERVRRGETIKF